MSKPDMLNYFDSPNKSPDGNDDKLVIGGSSCVDGVNFTATEFKDGLLGIHSNHVTNSLMDTLLPDSVGLKLNKSGGSIIGGTSIVLTVFYTVENA